MVTTLAAHAPVKQDISIAETAIADKKGQMLEIPPETLDEIKAQIETLYQPVLEETVTRTAAVEFTIPGDKIHMYKIHWIQQYFRADVTLSIKGQSCTASYVYKLEIPILDSYTVMSCTA